MKKVKVISSTTQPDVLNEYLWYDPVEGTLKTNIGTEGGEIKSVCGVKGNVDINSYCEPIPGFPYLDSYLSISPKIFQLDGYPDYALNLRGYYTYDDNGVQNVYDYCCYNFYGDASIGSDDHYFIVAPHYDLTRGFMVDYNAKKIYINGDEFSSSGDINTTITYTEGSPRKYSVGDSGAGVVIYGYTSIGYPHDEGSKNKGVTIASNVKIGISEDDTVGSLSTTRVAIAPDVVIYGGVRITTDKIQLGDKSSNNTYIQFSENAVTFYNNGKSATLTLS